MARDKLQDLGISLQRIMARILTSKFHKEKQCDPLRGV